MKVVVANQFGQKNVRHIIILGVEPASLLNFRRDLILQLVLAGHRVTVMSMQASTEQLQALQALGVEAKTAPFSRSGMNPFRDLATMLALIKIFRTIKPDDVIAYTAKPVIYGSIAAWFTAVPRFTAS